MKKFISILWLHLLVKTLAFDNYYAASIPDVSDRSIVMVIGIISVGVNTPTTTSPNGLTWEIATTVDPSDEHASDFQVSFSGGGPSLSISNGYNDDKRGVCVVFKDSSTGKSYGCSWFYVEPDYTLGYCGLYPNSCYCDSTCITDAPEFC